MNWLDEQIAANKEISETIGASTMTYLTLSEELQLLEALKDAREALAACSFEPLPHALINEAIAKIDALGES